MTRNLMFSFLHNLTTSKKQQQLQASNNSKPIDDTTLFGVSKSSKSANKSKLKCDNPKEDGINCKSSNVLNGKTKKKSTYKTKFFLRKSRSTNSVSLSLRSTSPSAGSKHLLLPKQQNPVSSSQPSYLTVPVDSNETANANSVNAEQSSDAKPTKRKSLGDAVTLQGNCTQSPIKHDLSKKSQFDCSSTKLTVSNTNVMPKLSTMNGHSETPAPSSVTPDYLQPTTNSSVNLSSNSSLNSSSVKSIASKSNDGTATDKKRKSLSSSRQKKFHRRFKQVAMDEEVINYFSCAFVSDILLQGYMYITNNHIAFYSNVFGYVTKLLIPITSVCRISKEKTVKIIPNAIAVATIDERHVFSSFLSREAAYQLMLGVWKEALPMSQIDTSSSSAQIRNYTARGKNSTNSSDGVSDSKGSTDVVVFEKMRTSPTCTLQVHQSKRNSNSGVSEIDDESSSAISGNESLTQLLESQTALITGQFILNDQLTLNHASSSSNSNSNPSNCDLSANPDSISELDVSKCIINNVNSLTSTPKTARPVDMETAGETLSISLFKFRVPRTIHIAYFGLSLAIILALLAIFLFYRIAEIQSNRLSPFSVDDLNKNEPNLELYAEILKWQKDMQAQRVHLTKNVLANNLEQISQISDSLQTLSSLIDSEEDNKHLKDKISAIMGECNSLETCILEENSNHP